MNERFGDYSTMLAGLVDSLRELGDRLAVSAGALTAAASTWFDGLNQPTRLAMMAAAGALILLLISRLFRRRSPALEASKRDLNQRTRPARMLGSVSAIVFVGGIAAWASVALLASAVVANGVVSPEGYRKTVQHLEGGIIGAIHVKEGDQVSAGQVLISLKTTEAKGRYDELQGHYIRLLASEARLVAELAGQDRIAFPKELTSIDSELARKVVTEEQALLDSRLATRDGRTQILNKRIAQIEEQSAGSRDVMAAEAEQLKLIDQEIASAQELYKKGLERLPRILALQRSQADIRANQASNRAQVAKNDQQIGETQFQLLNLRQQDSESANEDLAKVRTDLAELRSQLPSRQDVLARTDIVAPIAGTVMNLRVTTESGVISSGQPLLDIVPNEPNLVIDSRIRPTDIDVVHPDMPARVVLTAYPSRHLPQIHGLLTSVSADRLTDERTGEPYFLAKVKVDAADLAELHDIRVSPGMPAEVMILTGEHTLLDYMVAPVEASLTRSFREN
ncbi:MULTISPECIES: HlyD family type I secretion periplasmic adaptor subunit [unclassified Mesorhizobium]|uniref:HlyD family type I secretion periplasmic adaptor subunit n=2 Tax=Mesorhizobium TaxID=68287 RepID=UPI000FCB0FC1|nr:MULTISPECIES: HlyD family type I secretion periplasmic adaptor subunit [unclassified Mesorhizobium]TGP26677.1 HlyD family type I secretion periplasmic adaptor subunit [Mesorhizobium sp. M1D.F.Ca.ET.231.01.1.1]TGP38634.1 HlyD family type I secretion periplasmic adaptor subunit [Mesorhizobium sp. M1D.F.Ca.ET.234.01.1.1]TGS50843.1 HlyD family type I secretion periplasmic adaptor subunit [Mesorhizobium sp. M1D.F.Ca.ET.184.01.1.1]TGS66728.1 HlyD family type I secretion periplasmic adaptor subunit